MPDFGEKNHLYVLEDFDKDLELKFCIEGEYCYLSLSETKKLSDFLIKVLNEL